MARLTPIRISKQDMLDHKRLVRNAQAKIRRTRKKYGIDLSGEIDLPKIEEFKTRAEYNKWKAEQKRFTSRGTTEYQFMKNPYGVVASKKELYEAQQVTKQAQRVAKELQESMANKPFISGGRQQGTVGQRLQMVARPNVSGVYIPPDFNFNQFRDREAYEEKVANMISRTDPNMIKTRSTQMKENFIASLSEHYNNFADDLIKLVEQVPSEDFYEMYHIYDEINFFYEGDEDKILGKVKQLESYFNSYNEGKVDMDLKYF